MTMRRSFFPEIQPYRRGRLQVSKLHEIYFEECGNPTGKPVIVLHGGPGGGISANLRRLHDPSHYRVILMDQRGCGQATPYAELAENTTWDLVADMEALRQHLDISQWQVLGGSWGATLALAYAQNYPERVTELIVRSIFAARKKEIDWLYQEGASLLFTDLWQDYVAPIPEIERHDIVGAYYKRLTGPDEAEQLLCATRWSQWEGALLSLLPDPSRVADFGEAKFAVAFARIECHYFYHKAFLDTDDQLLVNAHKLNTIPGGIIQGRYDVITPFETAYLLHNNWVGSTLNIINDAGHAMAEPGITDALVRMTDYYK